MTSEMSRDRIAALARPSDAIGLAVTAWTVTLTAVALALATRRHVLLWSAGQILLGVALVQWFAILHECGHRTLYRSRRANRMVGHLASVFAIIPFNCWQRVHAEHHRWTGWQDLDPTPAALVSRTLARVERLIVNTCWKLWIPLFSVLYRVNNYWNVRRLAGLFPSSVERRRFAVNILGLAAVYAAAGALVGWWELTRLVGVGVVACLIVEDPLLLSQHTHIPQQ